VSRDVKPNCNVAHTYADYIAPVRV